MTDRRPAPNPSLWRDPSFRRFWLGEAISLVGSQVTTLALRRDGRGPARSTPWRGTHDCCRHGLGETIGLRGTMLVGAVGVFLAPLWVLFSPVPRAREAEAMPRVESGVAS